MPDQKPANRREFLKTSALSGAAVALPIARSVHASGSDVLRVGLIGCGGRGSGAAVNALQADKNAHLVAMADVFAANLRASRENLRKIKPDQVKVDDDHCFLGFDAYQKVLASDVDVVLIALPTFFHPTCLKAAVDAGKHVFCEKIHAVDAPGVRMVLAATEDARKKGLSVVSGLCRRYDLANRETMSRVLDGAIGRITAIEEHCDTGSLRCRRRQPRWTEMEYQIQDWFNFFWLGADLPGLNMVHCLDIAAWAMREEPPLRVWGSGGRQTRVGPEFGDVWDHHAAVFEYANGTRLYGYCRQQDGCMPGINHHFLGTKGHCDLNACRIEGEANWRYQGPRGNGYELEHVALFSAIRSGKPVNNGLYMARSSMLAIMMTWACYTGQSITWDQAMKSNHAIAPKTLSFDAEPPVRPDDKGNYPLPRPGVTRFV